jgi:hypothetical protein
MLYYCCKSSYAEISFDISYIIETHHRSVSSISNNYSMCKLIMLFNDAVSAAEFGSDGTIIMEYRKDLEGGVRSLRLSTISGEPEKTTKYLSEYSRWFEPCTFRMQM